MSLCGVSPALVHGHVLNSIHALQQVCGLYSLVQRLAEAHFMYQGRRWPTRSGHHWNRTPSCYISQMHAWLQGEWEAQQGGSHF